MLRRNSLLAGITAIAIIATRLDSWAEPDCFCKSTLVTVSPAIVPPAIWQGFYAGGNLGGSWGTAVDDHTQQLFFPSVSPSFQTGDVGGSGVIGGVQFGYNWQSPSCCFVAGIEADIGGMDIGIKNENILVPGSGTTFASFKTDGGGGWYGDITGRLGYNWEGTLLYTKGGIAWFDPGLSVHETLVAGAVATTFGNSGSGTLTGWTVGAGLESMISPRWTWKVEYMHFDFGDNANNCCFDGTHNFNFFNRDLTINTVKVGFNYMIDSTLPYLK